MGLSLHCMISEVTNFQFSYSLSPGEGNGTPLQYSCLENPMDGGDWKAAVHGVAESKLHEARTWHNANIVRSNGPTPVLLPGKSHGWRSLVGFSPWGHKESDTTERLHFHFSLSCIGEGNGNPLQCSCLENPRDGGARWAAISGLHRVRYDWSELPTHSSILDWRIPWTV